MSKLIVVFYPTEHEVKQVSTVESTTLTTRTRVKLIVVFYTTEYEVKQVSTVESTTLTSRTRVKLEQTFCRVLHN